MTKKNCKINNHYNNNTNINVSTGEKCTIEVSKEFGIFGNNEYFNSNINDKEKLLINKYIDNQSDDKSIYSLCYPDNNSSNNIFYKNCAIDYKNPWITSDLNKNICTLPDNITLPENLKFDIDNTDTIIKPNDVFKYKNTNQLCKEKLHDWFSIPDYHLGNRYTGYMNSSNEYKCLKPCMIGYIPRIDNINENLSDKCVNKNNFNYGKFKGNFNYLPISLIMLFGSSKTSLIKYYKKSLENIKNIIKENDGSITLLDNIYDNMYNNTDTIENIYNEIENDLKYYIKNLLNIDFNYNNIIINYSELEEAKKFLDKYKIEQAYEIAGTFYNFLNDKENKDDKDYKYDDWKKEISNINGLNIDSPKFKNILYILKKCCNITFDGKTKYSKDILYILNYNVNNNDKKLPIIIDTKNDNRRFIMNTETKDNENNKDNNEDKLKSTTSDNSSTNLEIDDEDNIKLNNGIENKNKINYFEYKDKFHKLFKDEYSTYIKKYFLNIIFIPIIIIIAYIIIVIIYYNSDILYILLNFIIIFIASIIIGLYSIITVFIMKGGIWFFTSEGFNMVYVSFKYYFNMMNLYFINQKIASYIYL